MVVGCGSPQAQPAPAGDAEPGFGAVTLVSAVPTPGLSLARSAPTRSAPSAAAGPVAVEGVGDLEQAEVARDGDERPSGWGPGVWLVSDRGGPRLMLEEASERPTHHGRLRLPAADGFVVQARARPRDLPEAHRALVGAQVVVMTSAGAQCAARVDGVDYQMDVVPDGHEWERWEELAQHDPAHSPKSKGALAHAIWQSGQTTWLTASIRLPEDCRGEPLVARLLDTPAIEISRRVSLGSDRNRVLAAFRALPAYRAIADEHATAREEDRALPARWDEEGREVQLRAFELAGKRYASISVPPLGCSAWDPTLWAIFEVGPGTLKTVHVSQLVAPTSVEALARDPKRGLVFVVHDDLTVGLSAVAGEERLLNWSSEFHGCGC